MIFNLNKGTFSPREEAQRKATGFGLFSALGGGRHFPMSPTSLHGEQAGKKLTERLLQEGQVCAESFWLLSKPSTQLRMLSHQSGVEVGELRAEAGKLSEP